MQTTNKHGAFYKVVSMLAILVSMGFPGKFAAFLGGSSETLVGYLAFLLEIAIMLLSSGEHLMELRIINIEPQYRPVYLLTAFWFIESMLVTNYPKDQLISCVRLATTVCFALWLLDSFDTVRLLELIIYAQACWCLACLALAVLNPSLAYTSESGGRDFVGIMNAKNSCASTLSCGILFQCVLLRIRRDRQERISKKFILLLVVQLIMILMCHATGALIFALVPIGYLFFMEKRKKTRLPVGLLYVSVSVLFIVIVLTILPLFKPIFDMLGKDVTITGRTVLWEQIMKIMMKTRTFFGYGYEMFWRDTEGVALYHSGFAADSWGARMTSGAHNVLIEFWLNIGLVGIMVFFIAILDCFRSIRDISEERYLFIVSFMMHITLHGLTERAFGTYNSMTLFFFVALGMGCLREKKTVSRRYMRERYQTRNADARSSVRSDHPVDDSVVVSVFSDHKTNTAKRNRKK